MPRLCVLKVLILKEHVLHCSTCSRLFCATLVNGAHHNRAPWRVVYFSAFVARTKSGSVNSFRNSFLYKAKYS